jgi:biotin carboxyl carrier protein
MKYFATINGQSWEIDIDHRGRITIDGVELAADMKLVGGQNLYSLLLNGASYEVVLDRESDRRNPYEVMVSGLRYQVKVQDERSQRLALVDRSLRAGEGELPIKAPIPGLVVKVLVASDQEVAEGETLVILEAMKMENELRAPRAGVIHDVRVAPGDQVALGKVLMTLK